MLTFDADDFTWYLDAAFDAMVAIVVDLGDEDANAAPDLPGANTPYVILNHCIGVMEWWGGRMIAGRDVHRDRPAEFTASGPVAGLAERAAAARRQLDVDIARIDPTAPPASRPRPDDAGLPLGRSQAGVLLHIYEELAQHLGHLELTRDMLRDPRVPRRA